MIKLLKIQLSLASHDEHYSSWLGTTQNSAKTSRGRIQENSVNQPGRVVGCRYMFKDAMIYIFCLLCIVLYYI